MLGRGRAVLLSLVASTSRSAHIFGRPTTSLRPAITRTRTRNANAGLTTMSTPSSLPSPVAPWKRLIRFTALEDGQTYLGEPTGEDQTTDLGVLVYEGKDKVQARVIEGGPFEEGKVTDKVLTVKELLCPLTKEQVNTIRCLGLNYRDHAEEAKLAIPTEPVLFHKPRTSLTGPYPSPIVVPKHTQDGQADYESEVCVVIGRDCKDVKEEEAMDYVLGYTSSNDVSARKDQFATSQWSRSKGYDSACPIGPCIVSTTLVPDPSVLTIRGLLNGKEMQRSSLSKLIFSIARSIAFLSNGTTLERGSLILTGTPFGVGFTKEPKVCLCDGDEMRIETGGGVGTLINKVVYQ